MVSSNSQGGNEEEKMEMKEESNESPKPESASLKGSEQKEERSVNPEESSEKREIKEI